MTLQVLTGPKKGLYTDPVETEEVFNGIVAANGSVMDVATGERLTSFDPSVEEAMAVSAFAGG